MPDPTLLSFERDGPIGQNWSKMELSLYPLPMGEGEDFRRCSAVARIERSEIQGWRRAFHSRIALRSIRATPLAAAATSYTDKP